LYITNIILKAAELSIVRHGRTIYHLESYCWCKWIR